MSKLENNSEVLNNILVKLGNKNFGTNPSDWILTLADGSTITGIANVMRMLTSTAEVIKITDADGIMQWECVCPGLDNALEFASTSAFSIQVPKPGWDGTMEYNNSNGWVTWDGSVIQSGMIDGRQRIYIRGTGNTKVSGNGNGYRWRLTGTDIECNGNIENLLDYTTVIAGEHPTMADNCYGFMFYNCTSLTTAPSLPATTLTDNCYNSMFQDCTSLTTAPSLPATTLTDNCYRSMFQGCTSLITVPSLPATTLTNYCYYSMFQDCTMIKLSTTETDTYTIPYRIPMDGKGTGGSYSVGYMFSGTGGTFASAPTINTTYYLDSSNTIV